MCLRRIVKLIKDKSIWCNFCCNLKEFDCFVDYFCLLNFFVQPFNYTYVILNFGHSTKIPIYKLYIYFTIMGMQLLYLSLLLFHYNNKTAMLGTLHSIKVHMLELRDSCLKEQFFFK